MRSLCEKFEDWTPVSGKTAIYLISFDNGKYYVGQTNQKMKTRYLQHYRAINYGRGYPVDFAVNEHKHSVSIL
jgi:predicted GIY-YIG superfamily endonuclease